VKVEVASYVRGAAITTSDTVDIAAGLTDAVYVGGAGAVVWVSESGTAITLSAVPVGTILPMRAKRINATSTTATLLVALYRS
jgi:hypothetical protein